MGNETNKIKWSVIKGPIELSKNEWHSQRDSEDYLFAAQVKEVLKIINIFEEDKDKSISKNIAISGERGSGKTSILHTLKNILEGENYYVFDIVDPSIFNQNLNIIEVLVSYIYDILSDDSYSDKIDYRDKTEMHNLLKTIIKSLSEERQKEAYFNRNNPPIEILNDINKRIALDKEIKELLEKTKEYINQKNGKNIKDFILILDDIDLLDNKFTSKLINDISKYLDTKIILIFAYRAVQLEDSLFEDKINDNKNLLEHKMIELQEIRNQVTYLLEKIVPRRHRISLYTKNEILNMDLKRITKAIGYDNEFTGATKDWIYNIFYQKTSLSVRPVDVREETNLFLPNSIRGILQLLEVVEDRMVDIESYDCRFKGFKKNLEIFQEYFNDIAFGILTKDEVEFIVDWAILDSHQKNYQVYHYFYNKIDKKNDVDIKYPLNLYRYESYNLTIGDIYALFEYYKDDSAKTPSDYYMVYSMKVQYSVELLKLLLNTMIEYGAQQDITNSIENNTSLDSYLQLINSSVIPQDYNYYDIRGNERDEEDYIIIYGAVSQGERGEETYNKFLNRIINSGLPAKGEVRKGIANGNYPFRYRDLYSYTDINLSGRRTNYKYDLYTFFSKKDYALDAITSYFMEQDDNLAPKYLFYSMFHIDIFMRLTYNRRTEASIYSYAMGAINRLFSGNLRETDSNKNLNEHIQYFRTYLSKDLSLEPTYYDEPYSTGEQNILQEMMSKVKDISDINKGTTLAWIEKIGDNPLISKVDREKIEEIKNHLSKPKTSVTVDYKDIIFDINHRYPDLPSIFEES